MTAARSQQVGDILKTGTHEHKIIEIGTTRNTNCENKFKLVAMISCHECGRIIEFNFNKLTDSADHTKWRLRKLSDHYKSKQHKDAISMSSPFSISEQQNMEQDTRMLKERVVVLNVGGVYYATLRNTLLMSDSYFSGLLLNQPDSSEYFVDRDPTHFRYILNWMRGVRYLPEDDVVLQELSWEADYFGLTQMREAILRTKNRYSMLRSVSGMHTELRQMDRRRDS
jgi:hypothetical protein